MIRVVVPPILPPLTLADITARLAVGVTKGTLDAVAVTIVSDGVGLLSRYSLHPLSPWPAPFLTAMALEGAPGVGALDVCAGDEN